MIALSQSLAAFETAVTPGFQVQFAMDEPGLLELAHQGDLDAFNELVLKYQEIIYRQAFWMLGEQEAAEDAAQEAFIRGYQNMAHFSGSTFKAWMLKITTNLCIDLLRYNKIRPTLPLLPQAEDGDEVETVSWLVDPGPSTEALIESEELSEVIQACLKHLTADYRLALILVDIQELDYQQAAEIMGIRLGTLKSRVARGRMQMRQALAEYL